MFQNSDPRAPPPDSPWRTTQTPYQQQGQPAMRQSAIKLPNLPRLGSQTSMQDKPRPSGPQNQQQPTFAQVVKQSSSPATPTGKVLRASKSQNTPNSGAQILGSVNSQMMPRVNMSNGMSSLNTVLPGMTSNTPKIANLKTDLPPPQQQQQLANLSIQDKSIASNKHVETEKFGLKPLLKVMESKNEASQSAILGDDLSQSGLQLNNPNLKLSHTFASPWRKNSKYPVIPDFKLPACYSIDTVVPQQQKLQNFDEGALFYIFYTMPRDAMQEAAAVELTNRSWRYHKELKMWLTKDPMSEPIQTNSQEESGIYIFFDPTSWKKVKKEYILYYPDIA